MTKRARADCWNNMTLYTIIHGVEFWLAVAALSAAVAAGLTVSFIIWLWKRKRNGR